MPADHGGNGENCEICGLGGTRYRAPLLWLLLPFMAGLAAGRVWPVPVPWLLTVTVAAAPAAVFVAWREHTAAARFWPLALATTVALAGAAYFNLRLNRPAEWDRLPPREARLTLRITRLFSPSAGANRFSGLAVVTGADLHLADLAGQRLYFSLQQPPELPPPQPTSEVTALGVLETLPRHTRGTGFEAYLVNAGLNFKLTRGRLLGETAPPSRRQRLRQAALARLHAILGAGMDGRPELAAAFRAMLLGQKQELSGEQKNLFLHSGTMHLFAISGLHIGVIAISLHSLFLILRAPRLPAAAAVLVLLWLYVDITGASPSAVRAWLMCALLLAARTLRRPGNALSALAVSAWLVLLLDPMQLFSASFQMSYGIVAAILLLGLPLTEAMQARWPLFASLPETNWRRHHRWRRKAWLWFLTLAGIGLAATLVSTVTSVQFFNLFTPGALLANLLLVPTAGGIITAGFISLVCGLTGLTAGSAFFNHAGALILWAIDGFLRAAVTVPGLFYPARFRADWLGPAALAALCAVCLAGCAGRWRRERGGFWPPFVLVALVLLFGVKFG